MPFQPGNTLGGRNPGSRNKRDAELWSRLEARGDLDPADLLSSIVSNEQEPKELRAQAANMLMPFKYSKRGTITPLRYIEEPLDLPRPTSIEQANDNIARISHMKAQGRIDLDFAESLITDNRIIASNLIAAKELQLKVTASNFDPEQKIRIEGGLPDLPGTSVIWDNTAIAMNGHNGHNGHVIDHQPTESLAASAETEPPAQDPEPNA